MMNMVSFRDKRLLLNTYYAVKKVAGWCERSLALSYLESITGSTVGVHWSNLL